MSYDYKFAKQLKDAGFPQHQNGHQLDCDNTGDVCRPTLSELIEACGDDLQTLRRDDSPEWFATNDGLGASVDTQSGSTPEEAVGKLWLALHHA